MEPIEELRQQQLKKLEELRRQGIDPFPNDFRVNTTTAEIHRRFQDLPAEELEKVKDCFNLAGRIVSIRSFGKAAFFHLQDRKGKIQVYVKKEFVGEEALELFSCLDIGDLVGISGIIFRTKTGELTVRANEIKLLAKSLRPLPEKWHGLRDVETRYRQRYLDLIANPSVREIFYKRTKIIQLLRQFLDKRDFLEVETPMMHSIPGGAAARPFKTHHQALGIDLYLRIAPELYLKRLLIGGLERVYEINRNFRNEGLSTIHNPEFTLLEFYQAYATYHDLMNLTEEMLTSIAQEVLGEMKFSYQGQEIDLTPPWPRLTLLQAIENYGKAKAEDLLNKENAARFARKIGLELSGKESLAEIQVGIFDMIVEPRLIQPTFVTHYPREVSPLARVDEKNPELTERFELYIGGLEIANAFCELNDPLEQRERFNQQQERRREFEADEGLEIDEDFLCALEYAMPPAAGEGIGIDRLVMIFTDSASIREVIIFPQLRPK
ncbi:MAG: lysine--tRNA ligase [Deltaproteobacteria bacterium]|nr:MAG: lysine--tRNA ligase [Deltaproteobacteria bacterium]